VTRKRDLFEVLFGFGLILAVIWSPYPGRRLLYWTAFAFIVLATVLSRPTLRSLGLGRDGIRPSLWLPYSAVLFALCSVALAVKLDTFHPLFGTDSLGWHLWGYLIWAFLQQFILQDFFLTRLLRLMPTSSSAVVSAASLFAIAHLPNPVLTISTLLFGILACRVFVRNRNLYPIVIAHCILGTTIAVCVSNAVHRHMRVGIGYLRYHHQPVATKGAAAMTPTNPVSTTADVRETTLAN